MWNRIMSTDNIQVAWRNEEHPPLELLRQYQEDLLSADASHLIERHLLSCDICTDVVEGLVLSDQEQIKAAVHDINARLSKKLQQKRKKKAAPTFLWADWRMAAAILVLVCSIALIYFYQVSLLQGQQAEEANISKSEANPEAASAATFLTPDSSVTAPTPPLATAPLAKAPSKAKGLKGSKAVGAKERPSAVPAPDFPAQEPFDSAKQDASVVAGVLEERRASAETGASSATTISVDSPEAAVSRQNAAEPGRQITGRVVSSDGQGLPGVSVQIKDAAVGVSTDAQGDFSLQLPEDRKVLKFNYIGFEPKEVKLNDETDTLNVTLKKERNSLSEVAVLDDEARPNDARKISPYVAAAPAPGRRSFKKYIKQNTHYPVAEAPTKARGKVTIGFTVMRDGSIGNFKVLKSMNAAFDAEAIRLLKEGPAWKPAFKNGTPVRQDVTIDIRFRHP